MKATMTICLVVFLVFGFSSIAFTQEIPGGIVYSDGKNAVYYDYKTGQTTNLTADLKGPAIKGPLAASEDGLILVWLQGNKFLARRFPDGTPSVMVPKKNATRFPKMQGSVGHLTLSPEGTHLAFESTEKGRSFVLVETGKKRQSTKGPGSYDIYPKYSEEVGEYNAITMFYTNPNDIASQYSQYGNTACYPQTFPCRIKGETVDYNPKKIHRIGKVVESVMRSITTPNIRPGLTLTVKDVQARFSIRRDAHFLSWQKASTWQSQQFIALIYKTDKGWGPIEIRDIGRLACAVNNPKPGVYEIPVLLNNCQSLAWKPDGSLTYLSEGKVFSIDANRITEGIKNSGVAPAPKPMLNTKIPVKNILKIESDQIAYNIQGDRLHWASNDTFLFRGKEGSLKNICSWHQGKIERLCPAPEEFSYCDQPPIGITGPVFGKDRAFSGLEPSGSISKFYIGSIKTHWHGQTGNRVMIYVAGGYIEELEYALPFETSIEDIRNPSKYDYRKTTNKVGELPYVTIRLNQILLLKSGNKYAAIKPLGIEPKYKSIEEMEPELRRSWLEYKDKGPPPIWEWMTYEWKYWSASLANTLDKDKEAKPIIVSSTSGKSEALERFGSFPTNPPEFYITVGDIKLVWSQSGWKEGGVYKQNINANGKIIAVSKPETVDLAPVDLSTKFTRTDQRIEDIVPTQFSFQSEPEVLSQRADGARLNEIVLVKLGNKYAAIKPIAVYQKYKSVEEMPEHLRNYLAAFGPNRVNPRLPRHNGKCLTYEWKYWEIAGGKEEKKKLVKSEERIPLEKLFQIKTETEIKTTKTERLSFVSPEAVLLVGGIKTVWILKGSRVPCLVVNSKQEILKGLEFSYPQETDIEQIKNPAGYGYKEVLKPNINYTQSIGVSLNRVLLLKLGNSYAAIKPLEIGPEGTWIDFEWKSWSATEDKVAVKTP